MNRYDLITLLAVLILVAALPYYAVIEPLRMGQAQEKLRQQYVAEAADIYVENCVLCHGPTGEGIGAMPALNNPGLTEADPDILFDTIAHSPHGTAMAAWHVDEGGALSGYQVEGLVTLIQHADWQEVGALATEKGVVIPTPTLPELDMAMMEGGAQEDPHECVACHEEPEMHAERFGLNCSRCHTLQAWKPALLTRHIFKLDHGDEGMVSCQTCHTQSYSEHTCYECHDHTPLQMQQVHAEENLFEIDACAECHPTGEPGEAELLARRPADAPQNSGILSGGIDVDGSGSLERLGDRRMGH
jgi:mono/diheme cytochrome c family protein